MERHETFTDRNVARSLLHLQRGQIAIIVPHPDPEYLWHGESLRRVQRRNACRRMNCEPRTATRRESGAMPSRTLSYVVQSHLQELVTGLSWETRE